MDFLRCACAFSSLADHFIPAAESGGTSFLVGTAVGLSGMDCR